MEETSTWKRFFRPLEHLEIKTPRILTEGIDPFLKANGRIGRNLSTPRG